MKGRKSPPAACPSPAVTPTLASRAALKARLGFRKASSLRLTPLPTPRQREPGNVETNSSLRQGGNTRSSHVPSCLQSLPFKKSTSSPCPAHRIFSQHFSRRRKRSSGSWAPSGRHRTHGRNKTKTGSHIKIKKDICAYIYIYIHIHTYLYIYIYMVTVSIYICIYIYIHLPHHW